MHDSRRCRGGRARQARSPLRTQTPGASNRGFLPLDSNARDGEGERCARKTSLVVVDEEGRVRDDLAEQHARVVRLMFELPRNGDFQDEPDFFVSWDPAPVI